MLGTKTIGRALVFGVGYLVGARAGRARYDQIQQAARTWAGQLRQELEATPDKTPTAMAGAARRAWDDSDIKLGRP